MSLSIPQPPFASPKIVDVCQYQALFRPTRIPLTQAAKSLQVNPSQSTTSGVVKSSVRPPDPTHGHRTPACQPVHTSSAPATQAQSSTIFAKRVKQNAVNGHKQMRTGQYEGEGERTMDAERWTQGPQVMWDGGRQKMSKEGEGRTQVLADAHRQYIDIE